LLWKLVSTTMITGHCDVSSLQLWTEPWVWHPSRTADAFAIVVIGHQHCCSQNCNGHVASPPPHCFLVNTTPIIGRIDWGSVTYFFSSRLVRIANLIKQNWLNFFL
jgi:hypothetical protein